RLVQRVEGRQRVLRTGIQIRRVEIQHRAPIQTLGALRGPRVTARERGQQRIRRREVSRGRQRLGRHARGWPLARGIRRAVPVSSGTTSKKKGRESYSTHYERARDSTPSGSSVAMGLTRCRRAASGNAIGNSITKVVPTPGVLSTLIVPLCASTMPLAMARPSPVPSESAEP